MSTRLIATSTIWQLASQIAMAALSIIAVKFVVTGLTKELAGNYNSAYSFLQLFGILADFGLYAVGVREVSRAKADEKDRVLGALIVLRTAILLLSLGTALALVWIMPMWRGTPLPLGVTIASLVPFFTLLAGILRIIFQVTYRMQFVFIAEVGQRIISTTLIGIVIFLGIRQSTSLDVYHFFLLAGGIGAAILFLLSLLYGGRLMRVRLTFDLVLLKKILKEALPFGLAFLCMAFYRQFDVTMIALLRDDYDVQNAYYGFVMRMVEMGYIIPTFLLNSVLPILNERDAKGEDTKDLLGKTILLLLTLGAIAMLFSLFWATPLAQLVTSDDYLATSEHPGSDTALMLMSLPIFFNGLIQYGFYVLLTRSAWKKLVASLATGAVLSIILNIVLIPRLGFVGAALTSIAVHALLALLLFPQGLRLMPAHITKGALFRVAAFTIFIGASLFAIRPLLINELWTVIGLTIMSFLLLVFGWGTGLQKDLNR